ncbi:argininosuccinate lyase [Rhodohalobacter mucosus]|uniref:Argininosuccinate lyase n=1 Tax=Rhodohalobacter mucosus TaxID=2079485 RepID=A0A316U3F9_9BACT|nr:argininosuccinate lyase [Rhodohalobacter mucosus]PWN07976.1 argininosuccinate lyase [Rhodohalobacter mucosus]
MSKLWQKKTTDTDSDAAKKVEAFTVGNDYELDQRLVPCDVKGSVAHAKALLKAKVITADENKRLEKALNRILNIWEKGEFVIRIEDEDMHTAIENHLSEQLGELGRKIHAGRSRNDQVLTAMRLYEKETLGDILEMVKGCADELLGLAEENREVLLPGYTHTRKAMLSTIGLWAGGFAEMLIMQAESAAGIQKLINRSPLGTAAGFGTTFDIDRVYESELLGFEGPLICATTAQLSRGWVELQLVQFLAGITSVLNRLASDIIQYSSEAYGFFDLDVSVCTGSSIMPQKKNPDVAELIRGGHSVVVGCASTLQTVSANLISGYHRDLQLTKEPVLKAIDKTSELLEAAKLLIRSVRPDREACRKACSYEIFAAEKANAMVRDEGLSFREAYRRVAAELKHEDAVPRDIRLEQYSHLGAPGNPGLALLRKRLLRM